MGLLLVGMWVVVCGFVDFGGILEQTQLLIVFGITGSPKKD